MKSSRQFKGNPSSDLLVCFPSRSHLPLLPNPLYSPARTSDRRRHRRRKSAESPASWAKGKTITTTEISEPSSPKVTCAGQIKMKPKNRKSWESVMEEIEKIQNRRKKRFNWVESIWFKKDLMQFLTCLRRIRFDFRCFKAFPETELSDDDDEDDEEEKTEEVERNRDEFSKWVMVLDENDGSVEPARNAVLLMRCRSAPARSWEEETEEEEVKVKKSLKLLMEEENRENLGLGLFSRSKSCKV